MERRDGAGKRIALKIQYDGTHFIGLQIQDKGRSVQDDLEKSIEILTREKVRIIASGRTDTGVHALGQVIHFDMQSEIPLKRICVGLNGILQKDISVINAYEVSADFHSRFSALSREYRYYIYNNPQRSPFMLYRSMWVHHNLEKGFLEESLKYLEGEHDFASFCKKQSASEGTVRKIEKIYVNKYNDVYEIIIKGNAFLHNMIRIIIGTLVDMAKKDMRPEKMMEILETKDRDAGGPTAPPFGLYLYNIVYDPPLDTYISAL